MFNFTEHIIHLHIHSSSKCLAWIKKCSHIWLETLTDFHGNEAKKNFLVIYLFFKSFINRKSGPHGIAENAGMRQFLYTSFSLWQKSVFKF